MDILPRNALKSLVCLSGVLLLSGCPGVLRPPEKPTVELRSVTVLSVGLGGLDSRLSFGMTNPNSFGLPLRAIDWELSIGGSSPIRGRVDLAETIPAKGTAPVDVDLHISAATAAEMMSRLGTGARDYHVSGTLHFQAKVSDIAVAFDHSGSITGY